MCVNDTVANSGLYVAWRFVIPCTLVSGTRSVLCILPMNRAVRPYRLTGRVAVIRRRTGAR